MHERAQVEAMQEILTEAAPFRRNLDMAEPDGD
jgi:hypothetical protein